MSARIAFVGVALLIVSAAAHSQPQPKPPIPPAPPGVSFPPPSPPRPAPPPPEKSVDELLNELERTQAEKAALEKREQDLKAALRKKLDAQAERVKKLGVALLPAKEKQPDRVGRIVIEGNTKTPDEKIHKLVELQPGQVLPYPALEAARQRLEKAGFRDATVEVVPSELDSQFKDVRVKVTESDKR